MSRPKETGLALVKSMCLEDKVVRVKDIRFTFRQQFEDLSRFMDALGITERIRNRGPLHEAENVGTSFTCEKGSFTIYQRNGRHPLDDYLIKAYSHADETPNESKMAESIQLVKISPWARLKRFNPEYGSIPGNISIKFYFNDIKKIDGEKVFSTLETLKDEACRKFLSLLSSCFQLALNPSRILLKTDGSYALKIQLLINKARQRAIKELKKRYNAGEKITSALACKAVSCSIGVNDLKKVLHLLGDKVDAERTLKVYKLLEKWYHEMLKTGVYPKRITHNPSTSTKISVAIRLANPDPYQELTWTCIADAFNKVYGTRLKYTPAMTTIRNAFYETKRKEIDALFKMNEQEVFNQ